MDTNSRKKSYQAECFTPKRSLARSPPSPKKSQGTENISPNVTQEAPLAKDRGQNPATKDDVKKEVQNPGSSAKHAALLKKRHNHEDEKGKKKDSLNGAIDEIPPPSRWEIPRTPVRVVEHVQLQLATVPGPAHFGGGGGGAGRNSPLQRTPLRIKTPAHPLAHSNKAPVKPTGRIPAVGKGGGEEGSKTVVVVQSIENDESAKEGAGGGGGEIAVTISPPISVSKGIGTLPGLNCTENDLAFLQRMQSVKKYEELKAEAVKLEKAHKTAAEQREQFQHEVLKIERDLRDMKLTYQEAASSVNTLITANSTDTSSLPMGQSPASTSATTSSVQKYTVKASQSEETRLTKAKLARLRKINQLSSARVEKSEKEMKGKLAEVERERWQLQDKIREEERKLAEEAELRSKLQVTEQEQDAWKQKVAQEDELYTNLKNKLREAQSELVNLQEEIQEMDEATVLPSASQPKDKSMSEAEEKRRTEERLKRLIRRCELYIQRHQMLKEMKTN